ncbi:MAG: hypothetical protein A2W19_15930 [Spirochaetes bacterium RBG_16_49_21]|nr:MAG: hypothetical protein A2W19_15930 [Spirochaetes bacterium RBG_16_49_21]
MLAAGCAKKHFLCKTPEKRAEFIVKKLTRTLDLTEEQVEKLNKIKDEILAATKNIRNERKAFRNEALVLVKSEKLDRNAFNNLISRREQAWNELKPLIIDKLIEFHSMLTPEQKNKLAEKMEKFHHYCD